MEELSYLWLVAIPGLLVFGFLLRIAWAAGESFRKSPSLDQPFYPERYRPLSRLLDESEFEFLRSQPGYDPKIERALRRQRVRTFRRYLQSLLMDFRRLQKLLRMVITTAQVDRPDLVRILYRQSLLFWTLWFMAQVRLGLYELGIRGVTVDVSGAVEALSSLRDQLSRLQLEYQATAVNLRSRS